MRSGQDFLRNIVISRRYAKALFEVGLDESKTESFLEELKIFVSILSKVKPLSFILQQQDLSFKTKTDVIASVCKETGLSRTMMHFIAILVKIKRFCLLEGILSEYQKILDVLNKISAIEAKVADPAQIDLTKERIEKIIFNLLGKKSTCKVLVDPSIIGGVVLKMGDFVLDSSVTGRLKKMREKLL